MARQIGQRDYDIQFFEVSCSEDELAFILQVPQYSNVTSWSLNATNVITGESINLNQYVPPVLSFQEPVNIVIPRSILNDRIYKITFSITNLIQDSGGFDILQTYYNVMFIGFVGKYISCILGLLKELKIEDCEFKCEDCDKCRKGLFIIMASFDLLKIGIREEKEEVIRRMYDNLEFYCNYCQLCDEQIIECINNYGC